MSDQSPSFPARAEAYRRAIAETEEVYEARRIYGHQETALARAEYWEHRAGRAFFAAWEKTQEKEITR